MSTFVATVITLAFIGCFGAFGSMVLELVLLHKLEFKSCSH